MTHRNSLAALCADFQHVKPGKGAAFVRIKTKNVLNNTTVERSYRAGESLELADMSKSEAQFTYVDGDQVCRAARHDSQSRSFCQPVIKSGH